MTHEGLVQVGPMAANPAGTGNSGVYTPLDMSDERNSTTTPPGGVASAQMEIMRLSAENLALKVQLANRGVPEGFQITRIYPYAGNVSQQSPEEIVWRAIIERIPTPNERMLHAEWDLREGEYLTDMGPACLFTSNGQCRHSQPDRIRIEKRDT